MFDAIQCILTHFNTLQRILTHSSHFYAFNAIQLTFTHFYALFKNFNAIQRILTHFNAIQRIFSTFFWTKNIQTPVYQNGNFCCQPKKVKKRFVGRQKEITQKKLLYFLRNYS